MSVNQKSASNYLKNARYDARVRQLNVPREDEDSNLQGIRSVHRPTSARGRAILKTGTTSNIFGPDDIGKNHGNVSRSIVNGPSVQARTQALGSTQPLGVSSTVTTITPVKAWPKNTYEFMLDAGGRLFYHPDNTGQPQPYIGYGYVDINDKTALHAMVAKEIAQPLATVENINQLLAQIEAVPRTETRVIPVPGWNNNWLVVSGGKVFSIMKASSKEAPQYKILQPGQVDDSVPPWARWYPGQLSGSRQLPFYTNWDPQQAEQQPHFYEWNDNGTVHKVSRRDLLTSEDDVLGEHEAIVALDQYLRKQATPPQPLASLTKPSYFFHSPADEPNKRHAYLYFGHLDQKALSQPVGVLQQQIQQATGLTLDPRALVEAQWLVNNTPMGQNQYVRDPSGAILVIRDRRVHIVADATEGGEQIQTIVGDWQNVSPIDPKKLPFLPQQMQQQAPSQPGWGAQPGWSGVPWGGGQAMPPSNYWDAFMQGYMMAMQQLMGGGMYPPMWGNPYGFYGRYA